MQVMDPAIADLPELLRAPVSNWFERAAGQPDIRDALATDPNLARELGQVLACSPYVGDVLERYPDTLQSLVESGRLRRPLAARELQERLAASLDGVSGAHAFEKALRVFRHCELVRIGWRDLRQLASLEETLGELSALADAAICAAVDRARAELEDKYGVPRSEGGDPVDFAVIGMGKLGGRELNFSSDVDLIFLFSEHGQTDGERVRSCEEFFRSMARRVVDLLNKKTGDGIVYRVDTRLRPFGDSGPIAISESALESYLAQHGRDWERYAWVKARVINDWDGAHSLYEDILRPFIYRRYLDYGVFDSLRDMKSLIEAEVRRKEFRDNIKLGRGGIREIEFIVQTLQLVRGGSVAELRERELLPALAKLVRPGGLPADVAAGLREAYVFHRRFENRLQAINDRQTHDIPVDALNRVRMAFAMEFPDWSSLEEVLSGYRQTVTTYFHDIVLSGSDERDATEPNMRLIQAWASGASDDGILGVLADLGYPDPAEPLERLGAFRDSGFYLRLDEPGRQRLNRLIPAIVTSAARQSAPVDALAGALRVVESIGRRTSYFSLLNENPDALDRLVTLCARSDFLVRQIATHPLLLDELLDPRIFLDAPGHRTFAEDLEERLAAAPIDDPEARRDALCNFQQAAVFRVAVADLSGALALMKVSDRLTDIAELVLESALELAWHEQRAQNGLPGCVVEGEWREARLAIIAYGKLGGLELGYGSDLDIVFLHDSAGEKQVSDGAKSLDNATFFVRLARRIIHILTMATAWGGLYEVDTRLRPNGRSGLLVSNLAAFDRYQREDAWTWEHQALLRGRAVAGPQSIRTAFEEIRTAILTRYIRAKSLQADVVDMRARMRDELDRSTRELLDLKQGEGGVTDIEFIVQYLVLSQAGSIAGLVYYSDNIRQLAALAEHGVLAADEAEALSEAYRTYRRRMHRLSLAGHKSLVPRAEFAALAGTVRQVWQRTFG